MADLPSLFLSVRQLINDSILDLKNKEDYLNRLSRIERRFQDSNVYIGIVGEFSSGKSTLINALMGIDFFVTNAVQGTTTVTTLIRYANKVDMAFAFKDGTILKYSRNKLALLQHFLPEDYARLGMMARFVCRLRALFDANSSKDNLFHKLFDTVTTSNEASEELDEVTVYYPSSMLKGGIVIIDTPGTDSNNPAHTKTTERAIIEKCDLAMALVPAERPVSITLASFIEKNLARCKEKCYFLITKAELLRKDIERESLRKVVETRLTQFLGINNPKIMLAPTLLYLEQRGLMEPTGLLGHLSDESRALLSDNFQHDVESMVQEIENGKTDTIRATLNVFMKALNDDLMRDLTDKQQHRERDLKVLRSLLTMPLEQFMSNHFDSNELSSYVEFVRNKFYNECYELCKLFKQYIAEKIDSASTKRETQKVMGLVDTRQQGDTYFQAAFDAFETALKEMKTEYVKNFDVFRKVFTETYGISAIDFTYKFQIKPEWRKSYKLRFKQKGLTVFPLARLCVSIEKIKDQMKSVTMPQIDKVFENMNETYNDLLVNAYNVLESQKTQARTLFVKQYDHIIQDRIKKEQHEESVLKDEILQLQNSIARLAQLSL